MKPVTRYGDGAGTVVTALGPIAVARRPCPACGAGNATVPPGRYSSLPWAIKQCPGCGFVYLDPAPRHEALNETLSWERSHAEERRRRAAARPIVSRISRLSHGRKKILPRNDIASMLARHAPPGNVIDIGCADGGRAMRLPEAYVPFGIEISAELAGAAETRFASRGGRCVHAPAEEALRDFPDGFFVGAMLRSYLEHEVHPAEVLHELGRTLARGGVMIVKVPNYASLNRRLTGRAWCGFRFPDHVNYFTPASLTAMAAKAGFTTEFGLLGALPTSDNMWATMRRR
jgi:SAM-dependent methyltransferase